MSKGWVGPLVTGLIVLGIASILAMNFELGGKPTKAPAPISQKDDAAKPVDSGGNNQEYPIGDPVTKNHIQVMAVWLKDVTMDGMGPAASGDVIHLEADIKATDNNPNGFAKDEFVPYMKVGYSIVSASGGPAIDQGDLTQMIASDGLHYGANIIRPVPGSYKLLLNLEPPSAGGLGRHVGKGGVAAWWAPFQAEFEWVVEAPASVKTTDAR